MPEHNDAQALIRWAQYHKTHSKPLIAALKKEAGLPQAMCERIVRTSFEDIDLKTIHKIQSLLQKNPIHRDPSAWWGCITPGNVPDPVIAALACAALSQAKCMIKVSKRQQKFVSVLFDSIGKFSKSWEERIYLTASSAIFLKRKQRLKALTVFGNDDTVSHVRSKMPASVAFKGQGHKISISILFKSAVDLNHRLAPTIEGTARDIWLYDQRGCLSPQIIFVQDAHEVIGMHLDDELFELQKKYGPCRRNTEQRAFRKRTISSLLVDSLGPGRLAFLTKDWIKNRPVVYSLRSSHFRYPAAGQIVAVCDFKTIDDVKKRLGAWKGHLQGISVGGTDKDYQKVVSAFRSSPETYICRTGELQNPPLDWNASLLI